MMLIINLSVPIIKLSHLHFLRNLIVDKGVLTLMRNRMMKLKFVSDDVSHFGRLVTELELIDFGET